MSAIDPRICRTAFKFGSLRFGHYGELTLRRDGKVGVYEHPNESRYVIEADELSFLRVDGEVTSRLRYDANANAFLMSGSSDLYLLPIVTLVSQQGLYKGRQPIIVNSIPKAGTYLMDKILAEVGSVSCGLHLGSNHFDDNRKVPLDKMHWAPAERRSWCKASVIASLLEPGEYAVGHIEDMEELRRIIAQGVHIFNCVRDLRDILVSLYRFKKTRVAPSSPGDRVWRTLEGREGFVAFLAFYEDKDLRHVARTADSILKSPGPVFKYEDLERHLLAPQALEQLVKIEPGFETKIKEAIPRAFGTVTSTSSPSRSDWRSYWDPDAEDFFRDVGLADLNKRLGYPTEIDR